MSEHTKLPENTLTLRPSEGTKISIEEISNVLKAYEHLSEAITHKPRFCNSQKYDSMSYF